ncbi:hypothetical protein MVES1_003481 [Malassezia vespertilionis]|uniref:glucan 1,3-beta-glucosidase n=1 Tax=Malassezia vespertilionis TaxID=2020962 RepID=A0A2N1J727_9BASI|nr:uncharacterized protein MVES1_003481 [Malassezia vespertilionis]PKI82357.1 hypothetical protein MVES_003720 [Malassezia vespertilionis]WFD08112.1 hypothetical protein MVES1_003481 [Malassezia vespertilionis]
MAEEDFVSAVGHRASLSSSVDVPFYQAEEVLSSQTHAADAPLSDAQKARLPLNRMPYLNQGTTQNTRASKLGDAAGSAPRLGTPDFSTLESHGFTEEMNKHFSVASGDTSTHFAMPRDEYATIKPLSGMSNSASSSNVADTAPVADAADVPAAERNDPFVEVPVGYNYAYLDAEKPTSAAPAKRRQKIAKSAGVGAGAAGAAGAAGTFGAGADAVNTANYTGPNIDSEKGEPLQQPGGVFSGWRKWALLLLAIIVVLGIALGVGLGVGLTKNDDDKKGQSNIASHSGTSTSSGAAPSAASTKHLPALPPWSWTDTKNKVYGVNIGGLFVLERWMYEDWMVQQGGPDTWDEWTFSQNLGDKFDSAFKEHMNSWFTEDHLNQLQKAGINMLRVPIGYWPFLSTQETGEPYRNATQLDRLSDILGWAHQRNMYVLLDLHGLPGSQNGDQSSGHNMSLTGTTTPPWYDKKNIDFSKRAITTALDWVSNHPSRSVVSGFTTVNEPQTYGKRDLLSTVKDFYRWSIKTCSKYKMPVVLHHGFVDEPYDYWESFMSDQDPDMVVFDDHPYPAWFVQPYPTDKATTDKNICALGKNAENYPVPVLAGEWSGVTIVNETSFVTDYLKTQATTYGWSAGSMFFNFRTQATDHPVIAEAPQIMGKWSMLDMLAPNNKFGQFPVRDTSKPVASFTNGLSNACGSDPQNTWE